MSDSLHHLTAWTSNIQFGGLAILCRHDLTPSISLKSQMQLASEAGMSQAMVDIDFKVRTPSPAPGFGKDCWTSMPDEACHVLR